MIGLKGLTCPACNKHFAWISADNARFFDIQGGLTCPHCSTKLKYPQHLRSKAIYVQALAIIILFIVVIEWVSVTHENMTLYVGIAFAVLVWLWIRFKIKLRHGYIAMVVDDSEERTNRRL